MNCRSNALQNFQGYVQEAMNNGINMELLHRASGERWDQFGIKLRDDGFTIEQKNRILTAIKQWRQNK